MLAAKVDQCQSEKVEPVPGVPWHCSHCGHILAMVHDGACQIKGEFRLESNATSMICPACQSAEKWYCNVTCKRC